MEGRFVSKDPLAILGNMYNNSGKSYFLQDVSSITKPYVYTENNPINYTDPSGLLSVNDIYNWAKWLWNANELLKLAEQIRNAKNKANDAMSRGKCDEASIYNQLADDLEKIYYQRLIQLGLKSPLPGGPPPLTP